MASCSVWINLIWAVVDSKQKIAIQTKPLFCPRWAKCQPNLYIFSFHKKAEGHRCKIIRNTLFQIRRWTPGWGRRCVWDNLTENVEPVNRWNLSRPKKFPEITARDASGVRLVRWVREGWFSESEVRQVSSSTRDWLGTRLGLADLLRPGEPWSWLCWCDLMWSDVIWCNLMLIGSKGNSGKRLKFKIRTGKSKSDVR